MTSDQTFSDAAQEVWNRELVYWDSRTTGNIEQYMALWDDDFVGWPATNPNTGDKANIRKRIEAEIADGQPGSFTAKLEPLSVRIYGEIAIVFYRARYGRINKAGNRIEAYVRITHTWRRSGGNWRIIAGMSAGETDR